MAKIKPFKGIRPPKDFVEQVASRPYDVLNSEAKKPMVMKSRSTILLNLRSISFPVRTNIVQKFIKKR